MMKKLFAILLAGLLMLSMVACDLGNTEDPNKDNPGTSQSGNQGGENQGGTATSSVVVSDYTTADQYTDKAVEKMLSLGKTTENEKIVVVTGNSDSTTYMIYTYDIENGNFVHYAEYQFYIEAQAELYRAVTEYVDENMEVDTSALWVKREGGTTGTTYEADYQRMKSIPMQKVIE